MIYKIYKMYYYIFCVRLFVVRVPRLQPMTLALKYDIVNIYIFYSMFKYTLIMMKRVSCE